MNVTRTFVFLSTTFLFAALPAAAREVVTPEEEVQRELERKRQARPVLKCSPTSLRARVEQGQTTILRLSIRNAGGRTLKWSVVSAPSWIRADRMSGKLGFGEEEKLVLVADPKGRSAGTLAGAIVIEAEDAEGSPVAVAVTLDVPEQLRRDAPSGPQPERYPKEAQPAPPTVERTRVEPLVERPREQPRIRRPRPAAGPGRSKAMRWGVQAGLLGPLPGKSQDFDPAPFGAVALRIGADDAGVRGLEFGLGYTAMNGPYSDTSMLLGRARGLFPLGTEGLYLSAGGQLVLDDADPDNGEFPDNTGLTLDVGAMMRLAGRFEVGASYSVLLASENVPGMLEFAVGVTF